MRRAALLWLAACGRVGFDATATPTADSRGDGAIGDGAPLGWSHLVAYANQTCAALGDAAYCWGANGSGQLGNGSLTNAGVPVRVALPAGTLSDLAQGETHGCAIVGGALYCFGSTLATAMPTRVALTAAATNVSAGRDFTCVVAAGVHCWGVNGAGQLGVGDTNARGAPTLISGVGSYTEVRCGDDHACATGPGIAYCWGHNDNGTLGDGMTQAQQAMTSSPIAVTGGLAALPQIAGWHACAGTAGNQLACWGRNSEGELGNGGGADLASPMNVLSNVSIYATGGGPTDFDATCAVTTRAQCWGAGAYGRLGQGTASNSATPVDVQGLPGVPSALAIGYDHACAIVGTDIWCWGRGDSGQLGDGRMTNSLAPVLVVKP